MLQVLKCGSWIKIHNEKIQIFSEEILRQGDDFAFDVISASEIIRLLNVAFVLRIITY